MRHLFTDILDQIIEERKNGYQTLATVRWEKALSKRSAAYFAGVCVEDIDEAALLRFFSFIRFKPNGEMYSDKYLKGILGLVKAVFRRAVLRGYIDRDPFDGDLRLPRGKVPEPTERIVDNEDLKKLLCVCQRSKLFSTLIPLLSQTGMRIGEALGLYWNDVDFVKRCISVRRAVGVKYIQLPDGRIVNDGAQICHTKTQNSLRIIPITSATSELLFSWHGVRESDPEWRKRIEDQHNLHLVFPNRRGNLMNYNTLRESFAELTEEENICATFHKLRHSYASNLIECGVDIAVISKLLGHKSITTTADTYTKIRYEPKAAAIEKLEKYMEDNDLI